MRPDAPREPSGARWVVAVAGAALIVGALAFRTESPSPGAAQRRAASDLAEEQEPSNGEPGPSSPVRPANAPSALSLADLRTRLDQDMALSLEAAGGVRIGFVRQASVAAARGFREQDVLRKVDGRDLLTVDQARDAIVEALDLRRAHEFQLERAGRAQLLRFRPKNR